MFKQELFGYSKDDVNKYLVETLRRLESLEQIIASQKEEIEQLKRSQNNLNVRDSSDDFLEKAKQNADEIIFHALQDVNDLQRRIEDAIERELNK